MVRGIGKESGAVDTKEWGLYSDTQMSVIRMTECDGGGEEFLLLAYLNGRRGGTGWRVSL